jgi:hypothetical protein
LERVDFAITHFQKHIFLANFGLQGLYRRAKALFDVPYGGVRGLLRFLGLPKLLVERFFRPLFGGAKLVNLPA